MLSDDFVCPHCGHEKTNKKNLLPIEALEGQLLHFFCIKCGQGYEVSVENGMYKLEPIQAVNE